MSTTTTPALKVPDFKNKFLSKRAFAWQPSAIRGLFPLEHVPGMISLLAGKPNPSTFPFTSISVTLTPSPSSSSSTSSPQTLTLDGAPLAEALQYGPTAGLPGLVRWLTNLQEEVHHRKRGGTAENAEWALSVGSGSQDLMTKVFQCLINPGDVILLETPVYSGTLGLLGPEDCDMIEIETDSQGLSPSSLLTTLQNYPTTHPNKPFPKLLYTIPTGSNPTGYTIHNERKREILRICREYDLLLLEDDAYWFLWYGNDVGGGADGGVRVNGTGTGGSGEEERRKSYFELEGEMGGEVGRVVRFDSFSKVLSSGMRLGFLTAHPLLLQKVDLHTANTNLQCSSTTQALALLLLEHWGIEGFLQHTDRVADFYKDKRDKVERVARKWLDGLADWTSPEAGMFLWIKLNLTTGSSDSEEGDSLDLISTKAVDKGFLAVPGMAFFPSGRKSSYVRTSFSLIHEEEADEAFKRLRSVILEARGEK